ncbi:primosomal protein N' [Patescibacteria group bacterium]|nr:primosomal protein N' [Patescibacteria group bacterium]
MYAEVILSQRFPKHLGIFDYKIPDHLGTEIQIGQLVSIPFRSSEREGVVVRLKDKAIVGKKIKNINSITNPQPIITSEQISLAEWMASYYFVSIGTVLKTMLPPIPKRTHAKTEKKIIPKKIPSESDTRKLADTVCHHRQNTFVLTPTSLPQKHSFYQAIIKKCSGATMIIVPTVNAMAGIQSLVPEQLQRHVVVFHSKLNKNQAYTAWQRVMTDKRSIVIGTKQALFLPLHNLQRIIIDSASDQNHKQSEQNPRYDVRIVAQQLQKLYQAKLIFVDPAPTVALYHKIINHQVMLLPLVNTESPTPTIVDMKEERRSGNYGLLSDKLQKEIDSNIQSGGKIFLFINKRGSSSAVMCQDCGHILPCPKCGTTMAYHSKSKTLFCHHCNNKTELPASCPKCQGTNLKMIGMGTQSVEQEIKKLWPKVSLARYDSDTDALPDKHTQIIIGTVRAWQILDWDNIKLIGIISADTLLHLPDYRSQEKTWQLLHDIKFYSNAPLVIQTHSPDNNAIKSFAKGDAKSFYTTEIDDRKLLEYPPHGRLIKLIFSHRDKQAMVNETNRLYKSLVATPLAVSKITPLTPYQHGKWQMYVIIKYTDKTPIKVIKSVMQKIPDNWIIDRDPENLL